MKLYQCHYIYSNVSHDQLFSVLTYLEEHAHKEHIIKHAGNLSFDITMHVPHTTNIPQIMPYLFVYYHMQTV